MATEDIENHPLLLNAERIISLHEKMSNEEKEELAKWDREEVTGDGEKATSDWPGWKAVIDRLSH
jgi:hypothetical protein